MTQLQMVGGKHLKNENQILIVLRVDNQTKPNDSIWLFLNKNINTLSPQPITLKYENFTKLRGAY
jgi:hypothetical protein